MSHPAEFRPTATANLTEFDCKKALETFVSDHLCYRRQPAMEMKITSSKESTALHYKLETFSEHRQWVTTKVPYKGGRVDGRENGEPPDIWSIPCPCETEFKDDKKDMEVPHTAKVEECKACERGWKRCDRCTKCYYCDGAGFSRPLLRIDKECSDCVSGRNPCGRTKCRDGQVKCKVCEGYGKLKRYIQLTVIFTNHHDDYILNTTHLPDKHVATVSGNTLIEQTLPKVWPIESYPVPEINQHSARLVKEHRIKDRILKQRQTLRGVPVTEVQCTWEDRTFRYWIYGFERRVYFPDYPQQCFCGCAII